jgi:formiminotetrahydrofolate cyclodeaminase
VSSLWGCTLEETVSRLASAKGTPGGGAAAALSGCLGVALLLMVQPDEPDLLHALAELKECVDADISAFDAFLAARKDPELRAAALQRCIDVPARGAEIVLQLAPLAKSMAETAPPKMLSDLGVGLAQLDAALAGLLLNVDINLTAPTPSRDELADRVRAARAELGAAGVRVSARISEGFA